jgi:hypothetical protein
MRPAAQAPIKAREYAMAQSGMSPGWAISFCSQPLTQKEYSMKKHHVGGKKAHVKRAGRKKGHKKHGGKKSLIKA